MLAFNPQFLFSCASVNNDVMVTVLGAAVLLASVRAASSGAHPYRTPVILGTLVGLAALSNLSGLATFALVPSAYLVHWWCSRPKPLWPDLLRSILLSAVVAALVGGGWYLRNALSYGNPLGMRNYAAIFAVHDVSVFPSQALIGLAESLPSYWGVFGWLNVLAPEWYYVVTRALVLMACLGLSLRAFAVWRRRVSYRLRRSAQGHSRRCGLP